MPLPNYVAQTDIFFTWLDATNNLTSHVDNTSAYILVSQNATPRVSTGNISLNGTATIITVNATGTITANVFTGNGVSLTSLNASALATGTVPLARLTSANTSATGVVDTTTQTFAGNKTFQNAASFSNTVSITGAANTLSTLGVTGNATFNQDVTISGNLTVSGATTYINTTNLQIGDNILTLNADLPAITAPTENAGMEINRGSSANVALRWNEGTDVWDATTDGTNYGTLITTLSSTGINASALSTGTVPLARLTSANTTANGVVDTTTQTFAGNKTFQNAASFSNTVSMTGAVNALSTVGVTGTFTALGLSTLTGNATFSGSRTFFASGSVLDWNSGDVTLTHAADTLTFAGAATGYVFNTGNVGIANNSPAHKLRVEGTLSVTGNATFNTSTLFVDAVNDRIGVGITALRSEFLAGAVTPAFQLEGTTTAAALSILRNANSTAASRLFLAKTRGTATGDKTIVQSGDRLGLIEFGGADGNTIQTGARISVEVDGTPTANTFVPGRIVFATANSTNVDPVEVMRITNDATVGIATTTFGSEATVYLGAKSVSEGGQLTLQRGTSYTWASSIDNYQDTFRILGGNNNSTNVSHFVISMSTGNTGIGTTINPAYKLEVNGSFAATTKSFVIPHPTKPNMKLRYSSLEGPEHGVYVRGTSTTDTIDLPEYWWALVNAASITVTLTSIGSDQQLYVKHANSSQVVIGSSRWFGWTPHFYYVVHAERQDVPVLETEYVAG